MNKKFQLDILKIVEVFAVWICQNVQKVKVKKYTVENTPLKYLNGTEIYICPDNWLQNSDRGLKLQRMIDNSM